MILTMHNLNRLLQKNSLNYTSDPEKKTFSASFRSTEDADVTQVDILVSDHDIRFTSYLKKELTQEEMGRAAEFITRANNNLSMGSLQLDYATGSVYFRVNCHLDEKQELSAGELAPYLFVGPMTAELYGKNGLEPVLREELSPQQAVEIIREADQKPMMSFVLPDPPPNFRLRRRTDLHQASRKKTEEKRKEPDFEEGDFSFDDWEGGSVTEAIHNYLDEQEWHYSFDPSRRVFRMKFASKWVDSYQIYTAIGPEEEYFITLTVFPIKVPENKRNEAHEFIARANFGMIQGCFEMNPKDGEIQFKSVCMLGETELSSDLVEYHIDMGFRMLDRYGGELMQVLFGGKAPQEAIRDAEKDVRDDEPASSAPSESSVPPASPQPPQGENRPRRSFGQWLRDLFNRNQDHEEDEGGQV